MHSNRPFRLGAIILLGVVTILTITVLVTHFSSLAAQREALQQASAQGPVVEVVEASLSPPRQTVTVLASVRPFYEATLYAKVSGYLSNVLVDKGDVVKTGQLLATIESEETDAQYNSAKADLYNKQQIAKRYRQLLDQNAIAIQQAEQAEADARMAAATLDQNQTLKSYERLIAPFDGKVTARFADPGALVQNATSSQTSSQPVVTVSDDRTLRIDAYVQQSVAPFVRQGDSADIVDASIPGRSVRATITHVAGELDPRTRTMLVEVVLDNRNHFLLGGSFAYMTLHVPVVRQVQIPIASLQTRGTEQFVPVVGADSRVHFVKVSVDSTEGNTVTLASGLTAGVKVAINLPEETPDGSLVRAVTVQSSQLP